MHETFLHARVMNGTIDFFAREEKESKDASVLTGAAGCLAGAGYILVLGNCFLEIAAASTIHYAHDHFTMCS